MKKYVAKGGILILALAVSVAGLPAQAQAPAAAPAAAPQDQTPAPAAQDPAAAPAAASPDQPAATPNASEIVIPEGTEFKLQLHSTISSKNSKPGDRVLTTLLDPVSVEDEDVLPKGVRIDGHIGEVKEAQRRGRGGTMTIVFDTVEMPSGEKLAIQGSLTEVFSSTNNGSNNVGPEGDLKGGGANIKEQAAMVLIPTAAGAAGGLTTGIIGAGAGVAMALLIPKGKQASLSAGSLIGMRLDRDVTVSTPQGAGK